MVKITPEEAIDALRKKIAANPFCKPYRMSKEEKEIAMRQEDLLRDDYYSKNVEPMTHEQLLFANGR